MRPRARIALAVLLLAAGPGCVTLGRTTSGGIPPAAAVAEIRKGDGVGHVLARLGAPVELSVAPDGMLFIWRERAYEFDRLGIDPSRAISFLDLGGIASDALSNLRLILERGTMRDERVAVLFDPAGRVTAVAHRDREGRRLR